MAPALEREGLDPVVVVALYARGLTSSFVRWRTRPMEVGPAEESPNPVVAHRPFCALPLRSV